MTVSTTSNRISYAGNGVTLAFTVPYAFYVNTDLIVLVRSAAGVETTKILTTDYTVSGGNGLSGIVTMIVAPATGETLVLLRALPLTQLTDYVNNAIEDAEVIERSFDRLIMLGQQINEISLRSITLGTTSALSGVILPDPGAAKFIRWNVGGTQLEVADITGMGSIGVPVSIVNGGTSATTANAALAALGSTPAASPIFTGTMTAAAANFSGATTVPNKASGDNTTAASNTAFVQQELGSNTNPKVPVRQSVLGGSLDTNGQANWLAIGTGLQVNYNATAKAVAMAFANGFDARGEIDTVVNLTADATNQFGTLAANSTSFLYGDKLTATTITGANTLVPPQYGEIYDRARSALIHADGTNGAALSGGNWTTGLQPGDAYGNTWTTNGNAQLSTGQFKFGTASVLCDGAGDFLELAPAGGCTFQRDGSWTMEGFFRWATLPVATENQTIFTAGQTATDFGTLLELNNTTGTIKLRLSLSSNGTSADITSLTLGTSTSWATAQFYHIVLTYDALAGKYFVYKDGVAEAALTITSTLQVASAVKVRIGERLDATLQQFNGNFDEVRFSPCCRYPNGTTFTPTASAFTPDGHFFSIPDMVMREVTGATTGAGIDPAFTTRSSRLFVGDGDTSAGAVTAVRSYAYRGRYTSADTTIPAIGTRTAFAANLGVVPKAEPVLMLRNVVTEGGWMPGMVFRPIDIFASSWGSMGSVGIEDRNTLSYTKGSPGNFRIVNRTTGTEAPSVAPASWKMFVVAQRGW